MYINTLYSEARDGDRAAEDRLFDALTVSFRLFVRQRVRNEQDGHEIVQEALMTIAKKYKDIEFEKSFSAWAYRVLEHILLRHYRSRQVRDNVFSKADDENPAPAAITTDPTLKSRLLDCLRKVSKTRIRHARILNLHFHGYSSREICGKLSISTGNMYTMLSRARTMLERCLDTGEID